MRIRSDVEVIEITCTCCRVRGYKTNYMKTLETATTILWCMWICQGLRKEEGDFSQCHSLPLERHECSDDLSGNWNYLKAFDHTFIYWGLGRPTEWDFWLNFLHTPWSMASSWFDSLRVLGLPWQFRASNPKTQVPMQNPHEMFAGLALEATGLSISKRRRHRPPTQPLGGKSVKVRWLKIKWNWRYFL